MSTKIIAKIDTHATRIPMLQMADFSKLGTASVTIYHKPENLQRSSLREIRADIQAAGFQTKIPRDPEDNPVIVEIRKESV